VHFEVLGEHQNADVRMSLSNLVSRPKTLVGEGGRHLDIDYGCVGFIRIDKGDQLFRIAGFADDVETGVRK
jgi:hypothetical protein